MPHDPMPVGAADTDARSLDEAAFIAGFRSAPDKASFLRLVGIPTETTIDGRPGYKLMEVLLSDRHVVGAATPGFGGADLVYHPFPGELIRSKVELVLVYCSATDRQELDWAGVARLRA